jgi:hypothetical protein
VGCSFVQFNLAHMFAYMSAMIGMCPLLSSFEWMRLCFEIHLNMLQLPALWSPCMLTNITFVKQMHVSNRYDSSKSLIADGSFENDTKTSTLYRCVFFAIIFSKIWLVNIQATRK